MSVKRFVLLVTTLLLAVIVAGCSAATPAATPAPTEPPTDEASTAGQTVITMGDIGSDPSVIIEGTQPLANYLAGKLADQGITSGQVKVAKSADEMTEWLKEGKVDLYFDSVYPASLISEASGAKPFIRRWKGGVEEYHTVIFAAKSSGITKIEDLEGQIIGFDTEFSTSGYVLPLAYLTEEGLKLTRKESVGDSVGEDEVGYTFSQADQNTIQWVISGKLSAAATDNETFNSLPDDVKSELIIIAETESLPRQVGIIRPGMDEGLRDALVAALLDADKEDEGQAALESFQGTAKFDEFPEGIDKALERILELRAIVEAANKK